MLGVPSAAFRLIADQIEDFRPVAGLGLYGELRVGTGWPFLRLQRRNVEMGSVQDVMGYQRP